MAYTTINKSTDNFNTVTFTGTNGSGQSITGVGFQPDWLWIKHRTDVSTHRIQDAVRGSTKIIASNSTVAESTSSDSVTSFDSDGFTHGTNSAIDATGNVVAWNWKANGSGSSNTDGSATSTVSVNTTAGFSIVKYTNQNVKTIGHGLGVVPKVLIGKCTSGGSAWVFASADLLGSWDKYLLLNSTNAIGTESRFFYPSSAAPTNSVFSSDQSAWSAGGSATENMICYAFAEKKGYSKFGSYTGNGNADGTFVYTGFKPSWLMYKRTDSAHGWFMLDNKRDTFNVSYKMLRAESSGAEDTGSSPVVDFLSNGFKMRNAYTSANASGGTYIYMAFAESPFTNSNGVPTNAR